MRDICSFRRPGAVFRPARLALALLWFLAAALGARAETIAETITVEIGKSVVLPISRELETVAIGDDSVADVNNTPGDAVYLFGMAVGETNLIASTLDGTVIELRVVVTHNLSEISRALAERFPGETLRLKSARGSLLVEGVVGSEATRIAVLSTVAGAIAEGEVVDRLSVAKTNIVRLQVRVLEVNRDRAQTFGIDWNLAIANNGFFASATNQGVLQFGFDSVNRPPSGASFSAALDLLISNGVATIVQDTTLAAVSGETANLQIGTEFPLPTFDSQVEDSRSSNFSVEYRFVGTDLTFTPTFSSDDKLRLVVDTMISELQASVTSINGNNFPNNSTRSFSTTVDLLDRQPFAIAGLSRDVTNAVLRDSTGTIASDVINTVFGTDRVTGTQQELVVIVTPILSDPADDAIDTRLLQPESNLDFILSRAEGGFEGPAGDQSRRDAAAAFQPGFKY